MINYQQELLGFAAKALGRPLGGTFHMDGRWSSDVERSFKPSTGIGSVSVSEGWNPLDDDGDCARLESALMLTVLWGAEGVDIQCQGQILCGEPFARFRGDRDMARRHASVNAAAMLGGAI